MRKSLKEEPAKKSPWLNAKKKVEKPVKPIYPEVEGELKCNYCGTVNHIKVNAQVEVGYPDSKFWAVAFCSQGECGRNICGWVLV